MEHVRRSSAASRRLSAGSSAAAFPLSSSLVHAASSSSPSARLPIRLPAAPPPSTVLSVRPARPALVQALAALEQHGGVGGGGGGGGGRRGPAAAVRGTAVCANCRQAGTMPSNFCRECGHQMARPARTVDATVRNNRGESYISYRAPPTIGARFKDGSFLLGTVVKNKKKLFLICNKDKTEVKWAE